MDKFNALGLPQRLLAVFGVMTLIFAVFQFALIPDVEEETRNVTDQMMKLKSAAAEFKQNTTIRKQKALLELETAELNKQHERFSKSLPEDDGIPKLIYSIKRLADDHALEIDKFLKQPRIAEDFVARVPVNMVVRGKYPLLLAFLNALNKPSERDRQPRLITVTELSIKNLPIKSKARKRSKGAKSGGSIDVAAADLERWENYEQSLETRQIEAKLTINAFSWTGKPKPGKKAKRGKAKKRKRSKR